ncbi:MAG TPA: hypothetical protein VNZ03_20830 [Terriglobales bacterium]|nr:hypothetical protein [Terriglobales bacterium]
MKFLLVLGVICGLVVTSLALDREAFTFTNYDLNVRVEPEQQRLGARGKIMLRNDSTTNQKNIALQISATLDWKSVQVGGKAVQFVTHEYTSDIDHTGALSEAIVTLPREVPPKGTLELEVGYEGVIPLDVTRLTRIGVPEDKAKHTDWDQISKSFTAVRGIGYVVWYPVAMESANLSEGNSLFETLGRWKAREAEANLDITLSDSGESSVEPPKLFCNGKAGRQFYEQMGRSYLVQGECSLDPLGSTVPLFVIGGYEALERAGLNISFFPGHKSGAENYALAAELAAPFVAEWFGAIRQKAETVELADPDAAPFESGSTLLTPLGSTDSTMYQLTAVHQLTHAAFFSSRPWIYEGLAHFAQALEREQQNGRQAALDFMGRHQTAIADAEKAFAHTQNAGANESLINTSTEEFYRSKAMYVWWMLRDMIGDAALKKALGGYHSDQDKESAYLQHLIEAQTHRDLEWFFDDWVYRNRGLPDFRVESAYPRPRVDGGYTVTIMIENLGDAGAEVPVTLRMEGGEVTRRLEVHAKSKAAVRIEAASMPREVVVNDGSVPESDVSNNRFNVPLADPAK